MYSPAAGPPCQANMTTVKATPMLIHTADSMAASLEVGACGVRWTSSRSTISSTEMNARNADPGPERDVEAGEVAVGDRRLGRQHGETKRTPVTSG